MKKIWVAMAFMSTLMLFAGQAFAVGEYSVGYRMGFLSGYQPNIIFGGGEGRLMLGRESSNSWKFSCGKEMGAKISALQGQYVWVKYQHHRINASMGARNTEYEVLEVGPVSERYLTAPLFEIKPGGIRKKTCSGRIVHVTNSGRYLKTYEVTMQFGNVGNQFVDLSIDDENMFKYVIGCLESGKLMSVSYVDQFVRTTANRTTKIVYKVQKAGDI